MRVYGKIKSNSSVTVNYSSIDDGLVNRLESKNEMSVCNTIDRTKERKES